VPEFIKRRALDIIVKTKPTGSLGEVFDGFVASEEFMKLSPHECEKLLI